MRTIIAALLFTAAAPALAGPAEDFKALQDDYWNAYLKDNPIAASLNGIKTYDRELGRVGRAEVARQTAEAKTMLARLDVISMAQLPPAEQANYVILRDQLTSQIAASGFGSQYIPYSAGGTSPTISRRCSASCRSRPRPTMTTSWSVSRRLVTRCGR